MAITSNISSDSYQDFSPPASDGGEEAPDVSSAPGTDDSAADLGSSDPDLGLDSDSTNLSTEAVASASQDPESSEESEQLGAFSQVFGTPPEASTPQKEVDRPKNSVISGSSAETRTETSPTTQTSGSSTKTGPVRFSRAEPQAEPKADPVSEELQASQRNLDNNGNERGTFDAESSAKSLYQFLDGADDERAIFNELAGRSSDELKQIQDSFEERYHYSLRSDLISDLGGSDEKRALAYLDGQHSMGDAIGLRTGMGDMEQVEGLLQRQQSPEQIKEIEDAYRQQYGKDFESDFNKRWSGSAYEYQRQANSAWLDGDRTRGAAAKAAYSLRDGDAEGVYQALSKGDNQPFSRETMQAVRDQYSELTGGKSLAFDINRYLDGNQERRAQSLQFGDQAGALAAEARTAMKGNESGGLAGFFQGWGTDESKLEKGYARRVGETDSEWENRKQEVDDRYHQAYHSDRAADVDAETSGYHERRLESLEEDGKLSDSERIFNATYGAGTTESEVTSVLNNISRQELEGLREDYAQQYPGRNLDRDVLGDVSGRLQHDASQWLRGMPERQQDPAAYFQEQMHRLQDSHGYEREGWQNSVGTSVTDMFSGDGKRLDQRTAEVVQLYDRAHADGFQGEAADRLDLEMRRANDDVDHYRQSKDSVTEGATTVATTGAAVGATVLTWGAATPLVAAAAIGAGGSSNLVSRAAMGGKEYTLGQAGKDAALGSLDGATMLIVPGAGKLAAPLLEKVGVEALATTASGKILQRTALGALDGAAGGATMGMAYAAAEDRTWEGGFGRGLGQVGQAGLYGGGLGAVTGGVMANALPPVLAKGQEIRDSLRVQSLSERAGEGVTADLLGGRTTSLNDDVAHLDRTFEGLERHQQQALSAALSDQPDLRQHLLEGRGVEEALAESLKARPDQAEALTDLGQKLGLEPPEGVRISGKSDANMSFQDYLEKPKTLGEKLLGRKLPAYVGTPYGAGEQSQMTRQLSESIDNYFGNSNVPKPDRGITIPIKDLLFAQGGGPTVNSKTLEAYRKGGNFGQELLEIPTPDGAKYLVIEGHHRTSAAMLNGDRSIEPGQVYTLDQVQSLQLRGYNQQELREAVEKHTRHLWVIDR